MSVVNLLPTIVPKSDQLNADDLIGGTKTIRVTKVSICEAPDQPIAVHFEGDDGKPFKPCKSMRRVMVHVWGSDGAKYAGQRMTLYRDDRVQFGGAAVGGIRISHMTGIDRDVTMALTATRASRKPYTVKPLAPEAGDSTASNDPVDVAAVVSDGRVAAGRGTAALNTWWTGLAKAEKLAAKPALDAELKASAAAADRAQQDADEPSFDSAEDDTFPGDRPTESTSAAAPSEQAPASTGGAGGLTLEERIVAFKKRCEGVGTVKLQSLWRASADMRSALDQADPEEGIALEQWFNAAFDAAETREKGG